MHSGISLISLLNYVGTFARNELTIEVWVYFWVLYSITSIWGQFRTVLMTVALE